MESDNMPTGIPSPLLTRGSKHSCTAGLAECECECEGGV